MMSAAMTFADMKSAAMASAVMASAVMASAAMTSACCDVLLVVSLLDRELYYQADVTFCDKNDPNDAGFTLLLSLKMTYLEMARRVAQHMDTDPTMIQFFRSVA